jgi:hypothetical protein
MVRVISHTRKRLSTIIFLTRENLFGKIPAMKIYISKKTRQALLDMGFPRQSINNWASGRFKPSRLAREKLAKIMEKQSEKSVAA